MLAEWFEYLNDDCDYMAWSQYFIEGLSRRHAGKRGLEVGCGSGAFSRALIRAGYRMTGADVSPAMLTKAAELARQEGLSLPLLLMDAEKLTAAEKYDFIIAPNDCYNYIPPHKLSAAFRRAANCLKKGGVFWGDVSSAYKLRNKIANNMFADDRDEVTYLSFNRLSEDRVVMQVSLFVRAEDGRYDRYDEEHTQYIHEQEEIAEALAGAGLSDIVFEGHIGEACEGSDRLNFICRKA